MLHLGVEIIYIEVTQFKGTSTNCVSPIIIKLGSDSA